MAKKVKIDVEVKGKGTKKVTIEANKAGAALDKTSKAASSTDRNIKGVAAASSGASKNFSKMAQGMTGGIVPAYAVLAANIFAIGAAFRFLKSQADLANLQDSQVQFAQTTGTALGFMTDKLKEASGGMLDFKAAGQATAIGLAQGFSSSQMEKLTEGARKVSIALGRDFEDSFDRLVRGASKAEPELLDELGIVLRLETATKNYAAAIGKQVTALTAAERSQAVLIETQKQLDDKYGEVDVASNPFTVLGATFKDLVMDITGKVIPAFERLATFIASNAKIALIAFGLLGFSIVKTMLPIETWKQKMNEWGDNHRKNLDEARARVEDYKRSIISAEDAQNKRKAGASASIKTGAGAAVAAGGSSKALLAAQAGTMTKGQQKELKKQLATASAQWKKHGKIIRGTFKGVHGDIVNNMRKDFILLEKKTSLWRRAIRGAGNSVRTVTVWTKKLGNAGTWAFNGMARGARLASKAMNAMMKGAMIFAALTAIYQMFVKITEAPHTVVTTVIAMIGNVFKPFEWLFNKIGKLVTNFMNGIQGAMNTFFDKIPAWMLPGSVEKFRFDVDDGWKDIDISGGIESLATGIVETMVTLDELKIKEDDIQGNNIWESKINDIQDYSREAKKAFDLIFDGIDRRQKDIDQISIDIGPSQSRGLNEEEQREVTNLSAKKGMQLARGVATVDLAGELESRLAGVEGPDQIDGIIKAFNATFNDAEFKQRLPKLAAALEAGNVDLSKELATGYSLFASNVGNLATSINDIPTQLGGDLFQNEEYILSLSNLETAVMTFSDANHMAATGTRDLNEAFAHLGGFDAYKERLFALRTEMKTIAETQADINMQTAATQFMSSGTKAREAERINVLTQELKLTQLLHDLKKKQETRDNKKGDVDNATLALDTDIELLTAQVALQKFAIVQAGKAGTETQKIMSNIGQSIESNLISNINQVVEGTKSIKQGFADMAIGVLKSLSQIITKLMVMKALEATGLSMFNPVGAKTGGVFSAGEDVTGYARGGVASGSKAGYPATLHGTEAVVPLSGGRSIPVNMTGGANNIVINISGDGAPQTQGGDSEGLGKAIARAVQSELQNQKRSGGILSPYGVA